MRLKRILENVDVVDIKNFKNYNIKSVTHISQDVVSGSMFICIDGNKFNGNDYVDVVVHAGAKCIVTENKELDMPNVCIIVVEDVRKTMSIIGYNFYNRCSDGLKIIGVIGTSGKTSTSMIIAQLLGIKDNNIGIIGTNGIYIGNIKQDNKFTTPDPLELHYVFYQMKMLGVLTVIMEVSAQAIYYKKVYGINFDICVFTNISREHLDFFGSMEKYVKVKMDFFNKRNMKECVVNIDDFYGRELAYKVNMPCVSYGINEPANSFAIDVEYSLNKSKYVANIIDDIINVDVSYVGKCNVYNVLAGLTVAKLMGFSCKELQTAIDQLREIDGRFNMYNINGKSVIIDFAHTPDSMDKLLSHIKEYSNKNITSLFGCVGYSDKDKRNEMAKVVAKYSQKIIFTSDNPGNVKFSSICEDVVNGFRNCDFECIEDREKAIKFAIFNMKESDILVIMGKGAENFQTIGFERLPYSDKESVLKLMGM